MPAQSDLGRHPDTIEIAPVAGEALDRPWKALALGYHPPVSGQQRSASCWRGLGRSEERVPKLGLVRR